MPNCLFTKSVSLSLSQCWLLSHVWLCNPMNWSLSGSSVHGFFQARMLEWVAISFSRGSSWPKNWTLVSRTVCRQTLYRMSHQGSLSLYIYMCVYIYIHTHVLYTYIHTDISYIHILNQNKYIYLYTKPPFLNVFPKMLLFSKGRVYSKLKTLCFSVSVLLVTIVRAGKKKKNLFRIFLIRCRWDGEKPKVFHPIKWSFCEQEIIVLVTLNHDPFQRDWNSFMNDNLFLNIFLLEFL